MRSHKDKISQEQGAEVYVAQVFDDWLWLLFEDTERSVMLEGARVSSTGGRDIGPWCKSQVHVHVRVICLDVIAREGAHAAIDLITESLFVQTVFVLQDAMHVLNVLVGYPNLGLFPLLVFCRVFLSWQ